VYHSLQTPVEISHVPKNQHNGNLFKIQITQFCAQ